MGRMTERRYMLFVVTLVWSIAINQTTVSSEECNIDWVPELCDIIIDDGNKTDPCELDDRTIANTCGNISSEAPIELNTCYMLFIPGFCRRKLSSKCLSADQVPCDHGDSLSNVSINERTCDGLKDVCQKKVYTYISSNSCGNRCVQSIKRSCGMLSNQCNVSIVELPTELQHTSTKAYTKETTVATPRNASSATSRGFDLSQTTVIIAGASVFALAVIAVTTVLLVRHCRNKRGPQRDDRVVQRVWNSSQNNVNTNNGAADLDRVIPLGATLETLDGGYSEIDNIRASMEAGQYSIILETFANTPGSLERNYEQITPQTDGYHTYVTLKTSNASQQYAHLGVISSDEHAYTSLNNDNVACIKTDPENCITESSSVAETRSPYFVLEKQDTFKKTTDAVHIASGTADDTQDKKHLYFTLESLDKKQNGHANDTKQNNVYHTLEKVDVCLNADACKGQIAVSEATGSRPCTSYMHINVAENVETNDVK